MEKKIEELGSKLEDHERRIQNLESKILSDEMPKGQDGKEINDVVKVFNELDLGKYEFVFRLSGIQLFIAVIHIAKGELGIDGISPTEISRICKEKIRVSKGVARSTISDALSKAGANVDRLDNPRGTGFIYRIMRVGEQYLQEIIRKNDEAQ